MDGIDTSLEQSGSVSWWRRTAAAAATVLFLVGSTATPAAADSVRDRQWHLSTLKLGQVHEVTRGKGVTIALIDTGVKAEHTDLTDAIKPGIDVSPDATGDGRKDNDGHGTRMAGIIAARGHGRAGGVLGIAPAAKILPIRAPVQGFSSVGFMPEAVAFAKERGAGVINMSFGGSDDAPLRDAIRAAQAADIVVVAASGNRGGVGDDFPGKYAEVLTVGATDRAGKIADLSVTGPQVDLAAPGVDIATTGIFGSGYYAGTGTSEAAAVVSGAVALVRAKFPDLNAAEVVHRLTATATDAGEPGRDDTYGYGRLDLLKALTADVPPAPSTASAEPSKPQTPPVAADSGNGPRRTNPLLIAGIVAFAVLLVGGGIVGLMVRLRRR